MRKIFIYCLKDPLGNIRYIGKTVNIKKRLSSHISEAKIFAGRRYVLNWVISLVRQGLKPTIEVIEVCDESNWIEREIFWISYYRKICPDLCNNDDGGMGGTGTKNFTKEEKEAMSIRMSLQFSKFSETEKREIWNLITLNYSFSDIKQKYPNFSQQMYSGIKNGKQWNRITNLVKSKSLPKTKKGYSFSRGLFIVFTKINGKRKVLFSSKKEEEVVAFLNKKLLN